MNKNNLFKSHRTALVCGAGGFIGFNLVRRLKSEGVWVRGVDLKYPKFSTTEADDFVIADLRNIKECIDVVDRKFDEVYQLAADMGGAGFVFTGDNDADIMRNSGLININMLDACKQRGTRKIFYSSSACIYSELNQLDVSCPGLKEESAYPAQPDSNYGWEKLFSERLYLSYAKNYSMEVRIGRYHNVFGPNGSWNDGREKAPAALCRKVAMSQTNGEIEVWGDGLQTRSFLYVDECIDATIRLMRSSWSGPVNIGSEEGISINGLANMIMDVAEKPVKIVHVKGPMGVRGRNSNNDLIYQKLGWKPTAPLRKGLEVTYNWINMQTKSIHVESPSKT